METRQQLIDSLTSHLALFHTSNPNPNSAPRSAILRWFSGLSAASRRAALTVVDRSLIAVVLQMLSQLHHHGHGFFFLLPDVPSDSDPSVPSVLFRRSNGLLTRVSEGHVAELEVGESVLLFCSDELDKGLDALTVTDEFVSDVDRFVEVMDKVSGGKFLIGNDDMSSNSIKSSKWPELTWLQEIGYYSLEAFLVNRLEIAIRVSWKEAIGGGRKGKTVNKGIKDKAGIASNVFWRKKGCLDWWARLDQTKRENIISSFLNQTTKSMANEIVKRYESESKRKFYFFNHQLGSCWQTVKRSFFRKNRSSICLDDISLLPYRRKKPLPRGITGLVALCEISLLRRNISHCNTDALFFTTLAMAGSVSDFVLNKLRGALMVVSVECTNLELLEDSGPCRPSPSVENKGKKKPSKSRRPKSGSKPSKVEDNNNCSTSSSPQSKIPSVNKEPVLQVQESSDKTPVSKENKNTEAPVESKAPSTKTKNKRKGKNNKSAKATLSKTKTLESDKTKNPNTSINNTSSLNEAINNTISSTDSSASSKPTENISPVLNNSTNSSNNKPISNTEPSKPFNNSCKSSNTTPNTNPTKKETSHQFLQNPTPQTQTQIQETNSEFQTQNQYLESQIQTNPKPQLISPLAVPLSYDWPPVYRNLNKIIPQYVGPAQELNHFSEDPEPYWYSEEENDSKYPYSKYNNIFGGGVMYWSPSEYINGNSNGPFSSRPPSLSSDDSAWARHEADIVQIVDEMSVLPPPGGEDEQQPQQTVPASLSNGSGSLDPLPYQLLRPIIVPNRISSRRSSRSDLTKHLMSPCIPSSARRDPSRVKRPPSPVVLSVPRVPGPPPPSPVEEGSRRRGGSGLTVVRSGSSSPRNWAVRGLGCEDLGTWDRGTGLMDGPEVVWTRFLHKTAVDRPHRPFQPVLQEQLIKISQWEQHPDIALPLQPPESVNCAARLLMHNLLHEEIDYFCKQVGAGNLMRKPYINWAINRVTKCLQVLWPRSRTSLFGSNTTGLALPTSDVDLVVSLPPVRNLEPIKEAGILEGRNGIKETCLQHAARYLSNQEWVRSDSLKTIENTAIPVIMLVAQVPFDINFCNETPVISEIPQECESSLIGENLPQNDTFSAISKDCTVVKSIRLDISFKSSSHTGLQTSELVRELTEQFPACVPLALILKKFLADRSLDHSYSGGLSSYCLVLLITRFLQHEHHVGQIINQNLGRLLLDFLYFFGNVFDPRQMRTSIQGRGLYMNRERGLSIDPIHIDDPLYPTNNVGRNCFRIHQCIKAFADAFTMLENEVANMSGDPSATSASSSTSQASQFRLLRKIIPSIDSDE